MSLRLISFTHTMRWLIIILVVLGGVVGHAQERRDLNAEKSLIEHEMQRYAHRLQQPSSVASAWLDVTYYRLDLAITTEPQLLRGNVTIIGRVNQDRPTSLVLDLRNTMSIDSVIVHGRPAQFTQQSVSFTVALDSSYRVGDVVSINVYYAGVPVPTGFGSFHFSSHNSTPWVWTLSEPYGARDWWPCKDHPSDKADSVDILATVDSGLKVGSNGRLVSVIDNGNGTTTYHWAEHYPITTYLVSLAITDYSEFTNWWRYSPTDSMPVLNYVLPENLAEAQQVLPRTIDMLTIFSDLFGLYPFVNEKYGHSDFGSGGAMEHQTMTSTTTYAEDVIAHELAHQWFGDMITCRTWPDIWLNEGFAQYATALYRERRYGEASFDLYMQNQMSSARKANGTIYVYDTSVVRNLFDGALVYSKGATVLHMLRHVLGDSLFFQALYNYANDPSLKYGTASTTDFQSVCESTSANDLDYFFDEWIFGESYPRYTYGWNLRDTLGGKLLDVEISQSTGRSNPEFFTMPIDLEISGEGWDTTITVFNDRQHQVFTLLIHRQVASVELDPENWILRDVELAYPRAIPSVFRLSQNYPNPFNNSTWIEYDLSMRMSVRLKIFTMLGQEVATLVDKVQNANRYRVEWQVRQVNGGQAGDLPSGVYIYRLQTPVWQESRAMLLVR